MRVKILFLKLLSCFVVKMNDFDTMNWQHVSVVGIAGGWASSRNESSFADNPKHPKLGRKTPLARTGWWFLARVPYSFWGCSKLFRVFFPQLFWVLNPFFLVIIVYHLWFWLSVWEELGDLWFRFGFEETFDLHCTRIIIMYQSNVYELGEESWGRSSYDMTTLPKFS